MRNTIRFDWAIKRLLRNKANFGILEGFLSELLTEDIKIESILESEGNKESAGNKTNRVDLLVQNAQSELVIIEVQSDYMQDYLKRMLFGTSKIIIDNMQEGMMYSQIKKVISVNIVYFDLGQGTDYIYHGTTNFVGLHYNDILNLSGQEEIIYHTNSIAELYPEYYIVKVNQFDNISRNTLDEWINFLKNEEVKEGSTAKGLKEASEKLNKLKLSKEERQEYDLYIESWRDNESKVQSSYLAGELKGKSEGVTVGIEIGEANKAAFAAEKVKEEKLATARKCLQRGMAIADIAELTGLMQEEIMAIDK